MPVRCYAFAPTYFEVLQITRVNNCGFPIFGPESVWTIEEPVSFGATPVESEAETQELRKPSGALCRSRTGTSSVTGYDLTIGLCTADPAFMVAANGSNVPVYNHLFDIVGWDSTNRRSTVNVAIEGWFARDSSVGGCEQLPDQQNLVGEGSWSYMGWYNVSNLRESGDQTFGSELTAYTLIGRAEMRNGWGRGPHDRQLNPGQPPQPGPWITPVPADAGRRASLVDVAPPSPTCGPRPLSNPAAPLMLITPGQNSMELCVEVIADGGTWMFDPGDGSPAVEVTPDDVVCHQYTEEGCYNLGMWATNNPQLYRGEHWCLPQTLGLTLVPSSGAVPLEVTANITGASGTTQPVMDWGD